MKWNENMGLAGREGGSEKEIEDAPAKERERETHILGPTDPVFDGFFSPFDEKKFRGVALPFSRVQFKTGGDSVPAFLSPPSSLIPNLP